MRRVPLVLCFVALLLLGCLTARADDDEEVPLNKLPKAVTDAVKKRFPKAKLISAEKQKEDGKTLYEVSIEVGQTEIEVTLTPEGKIIEIEKEIAVKDLPKAVKATLGKKYPKSTIESAAEITRGKVVTYGVEIVTKDKKTIEVELDPKGKVLDEDEDEEG
jgi:uncharacterized membrane protein YkoI